MKASAKAMASFIRTKRLEKKFSQAEFTKLVFPTHTSNQFLSNIERGNCQFPVKSIRNLSRVTGVNEDYILDLMAMDYKTTMSEVLNESENCNTPHTIS
ncbi:MAG: Helix-turn-helix domain [Pseudomonadota bacterium]|jgi:transcriptional regulator with XRE-family HTH domain